MSRRTSQPVYTPVTWKLWQFILIWWFPTCGGRGGGLLSLAALLMQQVMVTSVELCWVIYILPPLKIQFKFQSPHQEAFQRWLKVHVQTPVAQVSKLIKKKGRQADTLWSFFRCSQFCLTDDVLWLSVMSSFEVLLLVKILSPWILLTVL